MIGSKTPAEVIPALGRLRQKDHMFGTSSGYMVTWAILLLPAPKNRRKKKRKREEEIELINIKEN